MKRRAAMMAYSLNVSNISPWPGFFWLVLVQTSSVLAMVGIKQNSEIKGGHLFVSSDSFSCLVL